jgi:hypothetical protein
MKLYKKPYQEIMLVSILKESVSKISKEEMFVVMLRMIHQKKFLDSKLKLLF